MLKDKDGIVPAAVLTIICIITALLLAFTNSITKDKIIEAEKKAATEKMQSILPKAKNFKEIDKVNLEKVKKEYEGVTAIYEAEDESGKIGYVIQVESKGYGGMLPIMVAINKDKKIEGVSIMTNNETPGLGKKVENPTFTNQFKMKDIKKFALKNLKSDEQQLDFRTGATISSNSVKNSINKALDAFIKINK